MTRVKICGITRLEDALYAVAAGAHALGLVFYPASPRYIAPLDAGCLIRELPPFITVTGLFVNAEEAEVKAVLQQAQLDLLQFHGDETPALCEAFGLPYIKAIRMREGVDLHAMEDSYASSRGLLLDTYQQGVPGGTGASFDWTRIPENLNKQIILAGGLDCTNVVQAIQTARPYAVDVSGGVEKEKGIKDRQKIIDFMQAVRQTETV